VSGEATLISDAGAAERDPGGAEGPAAESAGLRRRKAMSTSGWLGDRTHNNEFPLNLALSLQGRGK